MNRPSPGVVVTRAGTTAGKLGKLLRRRGLTAVHWPCVKYAPPADPGPLRRAAERQSEYDWVVLSSPRAARAWIGATEDGPPAVNPPAAAAAGPSTAAIARRAGLDVQCVASPPGWRGLAEALRGTGALSGRRVLLPRSDRALPELLRALEQWGGRVEPVEAYRTLPVSPDLREAIRMIRDRRVEVVTFCSPSAVTGLFVDAGPDQATELLTLRPVAIGPTTAAAVAERGWEPAVADRPSMAGIADAVVDLLDGAHSDGKDENGE